MTAYNSIDNAYDDDDDYEGHKITFDMIITGSIVFDVLYYWWVIYKFNKVD